jgi:hypothetical protein
VSVWGVVPSAKITKLKKLNIRILKVMKKGDKFDYVDNICVYWQLLPFQYIVKFVIIVQNYFNVTHGVLRVQNYVTRGSANKPLVTPRAVNRFSVRTPEYIIPRIWNEIPVPLRKLRNKLEVKNKIKKWFLSIAEFNT